MILSILIPTLPERKHLLEPLLVNLFNQAHGYRGLIEIIKDPRPLPTTIGEKRNDLLIKANGKYVCFIDDDDDVFENYLELILEGIEKDVDCVSLRGQMTTNGKNPELFEHSLRYCLWRTTGREIKYERYPNHLNVIRASIAKQFKFPEISFGEDHKWSKAIHESAMLQTEHYVDEVTYHYKYISNK